MTMFMTMMTKNNMQINGCNCGKSKPTPQPRPVRPASGNLGENDKIKRIIRRTY